MDKQNDLLLKLIVLGESHVGKTSLLLRYCSNSFAPKSAPTIGLDINTMDRHKGSYRVKVQLWDTAGQERFRSTTQSYFKTGDGAFLVYDVSNRKSFAQTRSWLEELKKHNDKDISVMLIGNKTDLIEEREVPFKEAEIFARSNGLFFWETSAKDNNDDCVKKAFDQLIDNCIDQVIKTEEQMKLEQETGNDEERVTRVINRNVDIGDIPAPIATKKKCCS